MYAPPIIPTPSVSRMSIRPNCCEIFMLATFVPGMACLDSRVSALSVQTGSSPKRR
jgi:hypothetical protein